MFQNMAVSLFEHELIKTTLPKAKELRRVAEPLITLAKEDSVANRRLAFDRTRSKAIVGKLFNDLGPRYATRQGGTCVSSSAVSALGIMHRWLTLNWLTVRLPVKWKRPNKLRLFGKKTEPLGSVFLYPYFLSSDLIQRIGLAPSGFL